MKDSLKIFPETNDSVWFIRLSSLLENQFQYWLIQISTGLFKKDRFTIWMPKGFLRRYLFVVQIPSIIRPYATTSVFIEGSWKEEG